MPRRDEWNLGRTSSVPLAASRRARGPNRPVLLAVDEELGEGPTLRVAPELSDPVGSLEVGEHQDVEKLGEGSWAEGVEAGLESALQLIGARLRAPMSSVAEPSLGVLPNG